MALIVTPGAVDANSYVSVAEASGYFSLSFNRTAWADAGSSDKEKSLAEATRLLDTFVQWNGLKATSTQALKWPREFAKNPDYAAFNAELQNVMLGNSYIANDVIPTPIKNIVCELAYNILKNSGFSIEENTVNKIKVGSIRVDFDIAQKSNGFTKIVRDSIMPWGALTLASSSSMKTVKLART